VEGEGGRGESVRGRGEGRGGKTYSRLSDDSDNLRTRGRSHEDARRGGRASYCDPPRALWFISRHVAAKDDIAAGRDGPNQVLTHTYASKRWALDSKPFRADRRAGAHTLANKSFARGRDKPHLVQ
jgi:hypothetical protein